jgi:hypothetical protein
MFTPAMRASRTSLPSVIMAKAFSTQVTVPPFLNRWPLPEAMTTGFAGPRVMMVGPCWAIARPRAGTPTLTATKLRRVILLMRELYVMFAAAPAAHFCGRLDTIPHAA